MGDADGSSKWQRFVGIFVLHLRNARVPPGSPAFKGNEDGGDRQEASGCERVHPRLLQLLMHLREKRHRSRARLKWNAGPPVERTSEITREPDGTLAAWGVRGPWGCTRQRSSYCYPQISQGASRWFSARARETSADGSRGCQSFQKGKWLSGKYRSNVQ